MPDKNTSGLEAGDSMVKKQGTDTEMRFREADSVMLTTTSS